MFEDYKTFREIDESCHQPKGTAFRCFKSHLQSLTEGKDFIVLTANENHDEISILKSEQRVYPLSQNIVLLSDIAAEQIMDWLVQQSG